MITDKPLPTASETPWYARPETWGEEYLDLQLRAIPPDVTRLETGYIIDLLGLPPGAKVLDLCCGFGRHSIELARYGYAVTGLDLSETMLERARADSRALELDIRWIHSDMRAIPFTDEFDAIVNPFNSFGYLETDEEDAKVLLQVHRALKPGGLFVQQIPNREYLVRTFFGSRVTHFRDNLIVTEERKFDLLSSRMSVLYTFLYPSGLRKAMSYKMRFYTFSEIGKMLESAGLKLKEHYGGIDRKALTLDTTFLVTVSCK